MYSLVCGIVVDELAQHVEAAQREAAPQLVAAEQGVQLRARAHEYDDLLRRDRGYQSELVQVEQ